ncbi:MAG: orotidine-5'-phosphate decarboxylase [Candidatus Eisenbacteria bacterium]|uniref:Orotidine 5'-phosphate decarboxylase n=1 Tax=Eiseniibacteriota bacterium TaxID=2212470 RepID=A0A948W292_UNCEI|nr:orotidine-5'-phosphate decarboxylase [Candidatus Eisenbacteria bacterium]MBU1948937.1 orotidine-5'-phosphate decarboxylase [Candidatus Eisenbacteria bacterium]MBU2689692.1 orotidine-5'-phosphate decarboxylase [Candidatus Eisenbacteria bacterium]
MVSESSDIKRKAKDRLIVALDVPSLDEARPVLKRLGDEIEWFKIGLQLFCAEGPDIVRWVRDQGKKVFLDLKLHDIPNTVARAVESVGHLGAGLITLHAAAGSEALRQAAEAALQFPDAVRPRLLGVTVLTSNQELPERELEAEVVRLAERSFQAGLDGVVAPARSLEPLRERFGEAIRVLCAGIRPAGSAANDQHWIMTPARAISDGARWIVVGRPILRAEDPAAAAAAIRREISSVLETQTGV